MNMLIYVQITNYTMTSRIVDILEGGKRHIPPDQLCYMHANVKVNEGLAILACLKYFSYSGFGLTEETVKTRPSFKIADLRCCSFF